jgi:heptosyltransferase-2
MTRFIQLRGDEKVLVIRTDRIGDLVLTTPLFEALKTNYPRLTVTALVNDYARPILENNPFVDHVITYSPGDQNSLLDTLKEKHFNVAMLVYPRFRLAWLTYRAGIPVRIGTAYRWYSFFFTHKIHQHRKRGDRHELEYNLEILTPLGLKVQGILPSIFLSKSELQAAEQLWQRHGLKPEDLKVVIHPGGGRSSLRWSENNFAELAWKVYRELGGKIILTGTENERSLTEQISRKLPDEVTDLTGKLNLRELAAVLSKTNLIITNSTGPMHMAAALGVKVVALFCPIRTASPVRWGPCGDGHQALLPPVTPCHCSVDRCRRGSCMDLITVEEVFQLAKVALKSIKSGVNKS